MKLKQGYQMKQVGERFFLFSDNKDEGMFVLNETTKIILENFQKGKTREEILRILMDDFNEDNSIIEKDFFDILKEMIDAGIIIDEND